MKLKGIKEGKIKKLLDYFGSFEAIQNASASELSNAIGAKDGLAVYQFYRGADEYHFLEKLPNKYEILYGFLHSTINGVLLVENRKQKKTNRLS